MDATLAPPRLSSLVKAIWSVAGEAKDAILPGVIAPDSHVEFVFHLGAPWSMRQVDQDRWAPQPDSFIYAQRRGALRFDGTGQVCVIAFRVSPIVGARLLRRSLADLWDAPISLRELIGGESDKLLDALRHAPPQDRTTLIRLWIEDRLGDWDSEDGELENLFEQVMWHSSTSSIDHTAKHLGWSSRSLHRHLSRHASLSPKETQLAGRHLRACALLRERPDLDLTEIAGRTGFFDHAAFTHSFREHVGMTPSAFRMETFAFYERRS